MYASPQYINIIGISQKKLLYYIILYYIILYYIILYYIILYYIMLRFWT